MGARPDPARTHIIPRLGVGDDVRGHHQVARIEGLEQHEQAELARAVQHLGERLAREHADDQQRPAGTRGPGLMKLVGVDQEILAHGGDACWGEFRRSRAEVRQRAVEARRLGQHRDGGGAARGVITHPLPRVSRCAGQRAEGRGAQFQLGDQVEAAGTAQRRRRRQVRTTRPQCCQRFARTRCLESRPAACRHLVEEARHISGYARTRPGGRAGLRPGRRRWPLRPPRRRPPPSAPRTSLRAPAPHP